MKLKSSRRPSFCRPKLTNYFSKTFTFLLIFGSLFTSVLALPRTTNSSIRDSPKEVIDQVWQIIFRDYLDSSGDYKVDKWKETRKDLLSKRYLDSETSYESIREMLSSLKDPYTRFLDPKEFNEMKIDTTGELTGVGIQISLDEVTKEIVVISPIEGTPAFNAGVKANDVIVSINGTFTEGMTIQNAVKLIRGKKGTEVTLGLLRNNNYIKVLLVRDKISINSVSGRVNKTANGISIGYIRLKQFNATSPREMRNILLNLEEKNVYGYVLDLRSNPGGLLEASIDIARQWVDQGTIVSTKTRKGIKDVRRANGRALTHRPVVVLVNEGSASASEILSGAIQENKRGILIGKKTFGKGLVQAVRSLSDGSGLIVTVAKYLTPNGVDIHKNGINPDIEVEVKLRNNVKLSVNDLGTRKDNQYVFAENQLTKNLLKSNLKSSYKPRSSNFIYALQTSN